jgi:hypothetical protein
MIDNNRESDHLWFIKGPFVKGIIRDYSGRREGSLQYSN